MAEEESASEAAAKVQEVAANVRQAAKQRKRATGSEAETVARRYFEAIDAHDVESAMAMWAAGGREHVRGQVDALAPEGVREFIGELVGRDARPEHAGRLDDRRGRALRRAVAHDGARSPGPASFGGVAPTGNPIELEGFDLLTVRDGLIQGNDAFTDSMTFARQIGMMPPQGSAGRAAADGRLQRQDAPHPAPRRGRGGAGRDGRVGRAGAAGALQRVPDRERRAGGRRRDAVRRGRAHDDARGRQRGREARRDHAGRARPRPHRPPRRRAGAGRAGAVPPRRGAGRGGQRRLSLLAGRPRGAAAGTKQIQKALHRYAWDGGPVQIAGTVARGRRGQRASG